MMSEALFYDVVKSAAQFYENFQKLIKSEEVRQYAALHKSDFTRNRLLPPEVVINLMIYRFGKTLEHDLSQTFPKIVPKIVEPTKQAYHKALKKINPEVFRYIIKEMIKMFYKTNLVKLYKNYLVLAMDGTFIQVPTTPYNINYYGFYPGGNCTCPADVEKIVSKSGAIYDVLNGVFLDFQMRYATTSELNIAYPQIGRVNTIIPDHFSKIILADRYYPSVELFYYLKMNNFDFCIRGKSNYFKEQVNNIDDDGWIDIELNDCWLKRFKNSEIREYTRENPHLKLRVVKNHYTYTGKQDNVDTVSSFYFTSLPEEVFTTQEVIDLYKSRWMLEVGFRNYKVSLEAERVNSKFQNIIESRVYSRIVTYNLIWILKKEIDYLLKDKKTQKYRHHICKADVIIQKFLTGNFLLYVVQKEQQQLEEEILLLIQAGVKKTIPVRENRHEKRYGRFIKGTFHYRFSMDGRPFPRTIKHKGGMLTVGYK